MPRPKKLTAADVKKTTSMILSLEPDLHAMVKRISDATDKTAQPKVISLILADNRSKTDHYIAYIKKMHAEKKLKELTEAKAKIDKELEQLKEDIL